MKLYTQKDISELIGINKRYICDLFFYSGITPLQVFGRNSEFAYNIYQVDAFNEFIKVYKKRKIPTLKFDFENDEIFVIKESNIKNIYLTYKGNNYDTKRKN